jgi:hypothetical protein
MSTQLILYPQTYDGYLSTVSSTSSSVEFVVDGINFTSINSATQVVLGTSIFGTVAKYTEMLTNHPPIPINTWITFRSDGFGTGGVPAYPSQVGNKLILDGASTHSWSGVYQRLDNLTAGAVYTVTVEVTGSVTPSFGKLLIRHIYSNPSSTSVEILNQSPPVTATTTTYTTSFIAQGSYDGIMVVYNASSSHSIKVENISVKRNVINPTGIYTDLQDGQVICDLYQEEDIPLTLSVDDFKNVAEKVQSYSKDFNLPATKRNNQIFNNMFEITRTDDGLIFNPYVQTKCVLKQHGFILFEGFLRLTDIKDKQGEISYNVNLYADVIALADTLKDRTFSRLNFTELKHEYNITQIENSWNSGGVTFINSGTSGFRDADTVKYPFIDWNHQLISIPNTGNFELDNLQVAFRPCIQIKYLIDRIFADTDFSYTSNFFDATVATHGFDFDKLYMDFNWGAGNSPVLVTEDTIYSAYIGGVGTTPAENYATATYSVMELSTDIPIVGGELPPNYNESTFIITSTLSNEMYNIEYRYTIENTDTVDREIQCRWLYTSGAVPQSIDETPDIGSATVITIPAGGSYDYHGTCTVAMETIGDTLEVQFKTDGGTASKVQQQFGNTGWSGGASVIFEIGVSNITTGTLLHTLRGELGQWDFLKGIFTMFNLVTLKDETNPTNIVIEPYTDIFVNITKGTTLADRSIQHDWTEKVDVSEMELKPLTDLNKKTVFKFVEDDADYTFNQYKRGTFGHLYGSLTLDASTIAGTGAATSLQGTKEIIAEPFAATISKPLMAHLSDFIVPSLYAMADDGNSEGFDNEPRIFYNNGKKDLATAAYLAPAQNGVGSTAFTEFLQFSHLTDVPTITSSPPASTDTRDFVFESAQLIGLGDSPSDNLYRTYWQTYLNELYNSDTRIMTLKVNLTPSDINTFKFNDIVMIKNRTFRVNKIEYKPNSLAKVEFILIP